MMKESEIIAQIITDRIAERLEIESINKKAEIYSIALDALQNGVDY